MKWLDDDELSALVESLKGELAARERAHDELLASARRDLLALTQGAHKELLGLFDVYRLKADEERRALHARHDELSAPLITALRESQRGAQALTAALNKQHAEMEQRLSEAQRSASEGVAAMSASREGLAGWARGLDGNLSTLRRALEAEQQARVKGLSEAQAALTARLTAELAAQEKRLQRDLSEERAARLAERRELTRALTASIALAGVALLLSLYAIFW
ncbi:MAG: hypothetical protein FJ138_07295 [Deltaproteobacteria bacterium]|nr:hypothetical protein [Deltaproteobacteria bacterium]